jgi:hypothetical protein
VVIEGLTPGLSANRMLSNVRSIPACGRLKHELIVISMRDEFFGSPLFYGGIDPNGGDTSDTGKLEKLAFKSNACNNS